MNTPLPEPVKILGVQGYKSRYTTAQIKAYGAAEYKHGTEALQAVTAERDALTRDVDQWRVDFHEVQLENAALKADAERVKLTKIERECLRIGKEIQRAAGELPEGYEIEIHIEHGYGGVTLERPDYTRLIFDDAVDGLSHCITQAVDWAMKGTK